MKGCFCYGYVVRVVKMCEVWVGVWEFVVVVGDGYGWLRVASDVFLNCEFCVVGVLVGDFECVCCGVSGDGVYWDVLLGDEVRDVVGTVESLS